MQKSVAVLGLGEFGKSLAENLYRLGADVLVVDSSEAQIQDFAGKCTSAVCADLANEEDVIALGLKNMDIVVTAMGDNLSASIMSITVAKEQGVPLVVAKSSSGRMSSILRKVGADEVINPEGKSGEREARILLSSSFRDFYELDENLFMVEMPPREEWVGKSLAELNLRKRKNINVVAEKHTEGSWHFLSPDDPISRDSVLLIVIEKKNAIMLQ